MRLALFKARPQGSVEKLSTLQICYIRFPTDTKQQKACFRANSSLPLLMLYYCWVDVEAELSNLGLHLPFQLEGWEEGAQRGRGWEGRDGATGHGGVARDEWRPLLHCDPGVLGWGRGRSVLDVNIFW